MTLFKTAVAVAPVAFLCACSNPADKVPAASVSAPTNAPVAVQEPKAEAVPAANVRHSAFGPSSSTIGFIGSKVTGSHDGGFTNFVGEVAVSGDRLLPDGVKVVIATGSLWSDNDRLTGHLKNADFFDVEKYPTSTFVSTSIDQQGTSATVTGQLTLHGVTKQISFPATVKVNERSVEVTSEFSLNRFDFEMQYPGRADDLIRKEVVLKLNVNAAPGRADFNSVTPAQKTASL